MSVPLPVLPLANIPELTPARMLNEFAYCPRLAYLEWVQGEWADNPDTLDGSFTHRNVDHPDHRPIPDPDADPDADTVLHARSLRLESTTLGLVAVIDIVELDGPTATPVDYKKGQVPNVPEGAYEPERVQLCAQGLLLRAAGYQCDQGIIYFAGSRRRVTIPFDQALVARTLDLLAEFRRVVAAGTIPPPLVDSPKCPRCSLVGICLPDEVNLLRAQSAEPAERPAVRRLLTPRDEAQPLYVVEQGARVGKTGGSLYIDGKAGRLAEVPLNDVTQLCLFGNVQLSTQILAELADRDIPICYFSISGWFRGITTGLGSKNIEVRLRQFQAATDPACRLRLARQFVAGKIRNSRTLLRRNGDEDLSPTLSVLAEFAHDAEHAPDLDTLLGIEGMAAKRYFAAWATLLKEQRGFTFDGRNRRPPTDPVNAVLSYLYAVLAKDLHLACLSSGLEPLLGFLHQPRYGRPSLALDLAEEFRPLLADSTVLSLINTGELKPEHTITRAGATALTPTGKKTVLGAWERRMSSEVTHPIFGYTLTYRRVLAVQARLLARTLLGELTEYPAFRTR
jgi:CRISPR-associated protein Cas1